MRPNWLLAALDARSPTPCGTVLLERIANAKAVTVWGSDQVNMYQIQMRVPTPIHMFQVFAIRDYRFTPVDSSTLRGGFLVQRDVEASDFRAAFASFVAGLVPILDAISVVTQCAIYDITRGSFLIYRLNDNQGNLGLLYAANETETVGMILDKEEFADVEKLLALMDANQGASRGIGYFRHANLSSSPLYLLSMLIMSIEALAGESTISSPCVKCGHVREYSSSNKSALKEILGEELYKEMYTDARLRHKLLHGAPINEAQCTAAAVGAYERILLEYLREKCGLESVKKIVGAPRNVSFSYEFARTFVRIDGSPDLLALEKALQEHRLPAETAPVAY